MAKANYSPRAFSSRNSKASSLPLPPTAREHSTPAQCNSNLPSFHAPSEQNTTNHISSLAFMPISTNLFCGVTSSSIRLHPPEWLIIQSFDLLRRSLLFPPFGFRKESSGRSFARKLACHVGKPCEDLSNRVVIVFLARRMSFTSSTESRKMHLSPKKLALETLECYLEKINTFHKFRYSKYRS
jgi:hypothetical protein